MLIYQMESKEFTGRRRPSPTHFRPRSDSEFCLQEENHSSMNRDGCRLNRLRRPNLFEIMVMLLLLKTQASRGIDRTAPAKQQLRGFNGNILKRHQRALVYFAKRDEDNEGVLHELLTLEKKVKVPEPIGSTTDISRLQLWPPVENVNELVTAQATFAYTLRYNSSSVSSDLSQCLVEATENVVLHNFTCPPAYTRLRQLRSELDASSLNKLPDAKSGKPADTSRQLNVRQQPVVIQDYWQGDCPYTVMCTIVTILPTRKWIRARSSVFHFITYFSQFVVSCSLY